MSDDIINYIGTYCIMVFLFDFFIKHVSECLQSMDTVKNMWVRVDQLYVFLNGSNSLEVRP